MKEHCVHPGHRSRMSYPPQYDVICCNCGATGWQRFEKISDADHGPFAPPKSVPVIDWDNGQKECTAP